MQADIPSPILVLNLRGNPIKFRRVLRPNGVSDEEANLASQN